MIRLTAISALKAQCWQGLPGRSLSQTRIKPSMALLTRFLRVKGLRKRSARQPLQARSQNRAGISVRLTLLLLVIISPIALAKRIVNVYAWGGEISQSVIHDFEKLSGIQVNFATYDNNETMYAKLKASKQSVYDVILPSGYYVERMRKLKLLQPLNKQILTNFNNLDPLFLNNAYDPNNQFSVPFIWGATGIFYNEHWVKTPPTSWLSLWQTRWKDKLLVLDDPREVFSIALLSLGYSSNDSNPQHIKEAYEQLLALRPNIKLFVSEGIAALLIDEEAIIGTAWNGDVVKSQTENKAIHFIYPPEGFVIWVDCLAMPINPPHPDEAYEFINYLLQPEVAAKVALEQGHPITNLAGRALLPASIRKNPLIYPSKETLSHGFFQRDTNDETIALYNQYWELLKLSF